MDTATQKRIADYVSSDKVVLFMKGTPERPECGFSKRVVDVLKRMGVSFSSFNVYDDESIRQGIKEFANWPTIPQLYIRGKFIGGCDITEALAASGELKALVES